MSLTGIYYFVGMIVLVLLYTGIVLRPKKIETPGNRLSETIRVWLDDERPAWETVAAFERDVERVIRGDVTEDYVERMPLRAPGVKMAKKCRHRWTTIPPRHVDAMRALGHGLPSGYVGSTATPWCVKCRARKDGSRVKVHDSTAVRIKPTNESVSS